jgi:ABC-type lipoprotein release transport system permease subunit
MWTSKPYRSSLPAFSTTAKNACFDDEVFPNGIPLKFAFSQTGFAITLAITLVFGWLASRIPARKAISISNREALSYE